VFRQAGICLLTAECSCAYTQRVTNTEIDPDLAEIVQANAAVVEARGPLLHALMEHRAGAIAAARANGKTLAQIAALLNVSAERVRAMEKVS
jgi:DNA-binding NarL/FixJ family response regulator